MIFNDEDLQDTPLLTDWQIVGGVGRQPQLFGAHAFHEGERIAAAEIVIADPTRRWALTPQGGYRLSGGGTLTVQYARYGTEKCDN
jgi:hypothetical protein